MTGPNSSCLDEEWIVPDPNIERLEMANEQLRRQSQELAALAGSLAHEIKTPLSVIRLNVELIAEDLAELDHPETRRLVNKVLVVERQCTRLESLLNDFLRLTRLNRLELVAGSLNALLEQVLDFYEADARHRKVEIIRYLDGDLPIIKLDKQTLQAALQNMVKNALEAMPEGGQLVVRTRMTRTGVAVDLIDTGEGINPSTLIKMFEPFYTTKDSGSGLGLPMAKKVIEAHGGVINVQSEVGRGTQFTLEFPTPKRI